MGANLLSDLGLPGDGATFRAWAPRATAVYINGIFSGVEHHRPNPRSADGQGRQRLLVGIRRHAPRGRPLPLLRRRAGSSGYKRDPYARELTNDPDAPFPVCCAVIRSATAYPGTTQASRRPASPTWWSTSSTSAPMRPPPRARVDLPRRHREGRVPRRPWHQRRPAAACHENEDQPSLGYDGSDFFSPAITYAVYDPAVLAGYLTTINRLLAAKGFAPMTIADITPATRR